MFESLWANQYFESVEIFLKENNLLANSYLVGGTVRDLLLKRDLKDLDFAIRGNSIKLAQDFSKKIEGTFVLLDETFATGRVVKNGITIDFTELKGNSIEEDLEGRDFSINAMGISLIEKKLIDPFGGIKDLDSRIIKMVRESNLKEDPIRILRAYRFHATLNFDIDYNTREALKKNASLIRITAKERIKEELWKILSIDNSQRTINLIVEDNIFKAIFNYNHLMPIKINNQALEISELIMKNPKKIFPFYKGGINNNQICCLKFATIFGFYASSLIRQIKPSKKEERFIDKLIESGSKIKKIDTLLDKVQFLKKYENILYPSLIYGISIDPIGLARTWFYREIEIFYKKSYLKRKKKLPIIRGDDILSLGLKPSPLIGEILERIENLVLAGKITNKEEALKEISY